MYIELYSNVEIFIYNVFHFIPIDNFVNLGFAIRSPSCRDLVLRDRDGAVHNKIPYEIDKHDYREIYRLYVPYKGTKNVSVVTYKADK